MRMSDARYEIAIQIAVAGASEFRFLDGAAIKLFPCLSIAKQPFRSCWSCPYSAVKPLFMSTALLKLTGCKLMHMIANSCVYFVGGTMKSYSMQTT